MNDESIVTITTVPTVVAKHDFKSASVGEKGGEGAESGISQVGPGALLAELTPEGDDNT